MQGVSGNVTTNEGVKLRIGREKDFTLCIIMEHAPAVLSLGEECVQKRKDFVWRGSLGQAPYFIKDGHKVTLDVKGNCPYWVDSRAVIKDREKAMPSSLGGSSPSSAGGKLPPPELTPAKSGDISPRHSAPVPAPDIDPAGPAEAHLELASSRPVPPSLEKSLALLHK